MDRSIFNKKILPFNQRFHQVSVKDLVNYNNITTAINRSPNILTKTILTDDIKGYMQVHDIDPNIYRYTHTIEATVDFFDKINDWNIVLNGESVNSLLDTTNPFNFTHFNEIKKKVERFEKGDTVYNGDGMYPILKEDPYPYEELAGYERDWAKNYISYHPNVKRYKLKETNHENDDDTTGRKVFKEDKEYLTTHKEISWLSIRVEIIHNHLYIFSVNPLTIEELYVVNSKIPYGAIMFDLTNVDLDNRIVFGFKTNKKKLIQVGFTNITEPKEECEFYLYIEYDYIPIKKGKGGAEDYILNYLDRFIELGLIEDKSSFMEGEHLKPEFVIYFLSNVSIKSVIQMTKKDIEADFKLWSLYYDKNIHTDAYLLYRGDNGDDRDIDNIILGWIGGSLIDTLENPDVNDVHYGEEILWFNKLTKNRCRHLLPDTSNAISIPENDHLLNDKQFAEHIRDKDYDLFMTFHKISHEVNKRFDLSDMVLVDSTYDGLKHSNLESVNEESAQFFKISIYNFRRNPYDLFICDLLYTGKMIVEREYHWDHIYIPVVQLYKFLQLNKLDDKLKELKDDWGVMEYV